MVSLNQDSKFRRIGNEAIYRISRGEERRFNPPHQCLDLWSYLKRKHTSLKAPETDCTNK